MSPSLPTRSRIRRALLGAVLVSAALPVTAAPAVEPQQSYDPRVEYWVNTRIDETDAAVGDAVCRTSTGRCSLRAALQEAAADRATSAIGFDLPSEQHTLTFKAALPAIRDLAGPTIIDGRRPPWVPNSEPWPIIELRGPGLQSGINGLAIGSPGNTVRNLSIYNFRNQIRVANWNNRITQNIIGTNRDASFSAIRQLEFTEDTAGVLLDGDAANNVVDENVISGNFDIGVLLRGTASANTIARNDIGLARSGAQPNGSHGVVLGMTTRYNVVGGDAAAANAIAANRGSGIQVAGTLNRVSANTIGLRLGSAIGGATPLYPVRGSTELVAPNTDTNVVIGPSAEARIASNLMVGMPDGVRIGEKIKGDSDGGITGARVLSNEIGRPATSKDPAGDTTGVTVWQGNHAVLAYNVLRRHLIGFLIAPTPTPVTQIGNVFEGVGTNVARP